MPSDLERNWNDGLTPGAYFVIAVARGMKASVIRIGNSRGVRIPKVLLEQCRLGDTVELEVDKGHLTIRSAQQARSGWDEAFQKMAEQGDDALLDRDSLAPTRWDETEWEW